MTRKVSIILDSAIEHEKEVLDIGVHRKLENFVVTLLVMKMFSGFLGASRACAYFRDSTAEFRIIPLVFLGLVFCSACLQSAGNWQAYQDKAMSLYSKGEYKQALGKVKQALKRAKQADNGAKYQASSLNLQAFIQNAQGDKHAALSSISKAILLSQKSYGKQHLQVATLLFNKGRFLEQQALPTKAINAYRAAWDIQSKNDKVVHKEALKTLHALVAMYSMQHRDSEAITLAYPLLNQYQQRKMTQFSEEQRQLSYALADAQINQKKLSLAEDILTKELALERRLLKEDDVRIAQTLERMALVYDLQNKEKKSASSLAQALKIRSNTGEVSLVNAMLLNELALTNQENDNYEKANTLYKQALQALVKLKRDKGIEQALIIANLGSLEEAKGDMNKALKLYEQSLKLHQSINIQPLQGAYTAARAGSIYYKKRRYKQTEPLFLQSLDLVKKAEKTLDSKKFHKVALENLVALYDAWSKNHQRAKYVKELKKLAR